MPSESSPTRRKLLAAGVGLTAGLCGCLQTAPSRSGDESRDPTPRTPTPTPSALEEDACEPGASELTDRPGVPVDLAAVEPAPGDCPFQEPYGPWERRVLDHYENRAHEVGTVCSSATDDEAPLTMLVEPRRFEPPGETSITLVNHTTGAGHIPYRYSVLKAEAGKWYHVTPQAHIQPGGAIPPGSEYTWCVWADNSSRAGEHLTTGVSDNGPIGIPALGAGEYAFVHQMESVDDPDGDVAYSHFVFGRFTVIGDPIELTRTGEIEDVRVGDGRVEAYWTAWEDNETGGEGRYVVRELDSAPNEARSRVTEQIVRNGEEPLRDALVLMDEHDVAEVRIRGRFNGGTSPFVDDDYTLEYEGRYFEISST